MCNVVCVSFTIDRFRYKGSQIAPQTQVHQYWTVGIRTSSEQTRAQYVMHDRKILIKMYRIFYFIFKSILFVIFFFLKIMQHNVPEHAHYRTLSISRGGRFPRNLAFGYACRCRISVGPFREFLGCIKNSIHFRVIYPKCLLQYIYKHSIWKK